MKKMEDVRISQSNVTTYNSCKYLFKLRVLQDIHPRITPGPMHAGTLVHAGFEGALKHQFESNYTATIDEMLEAGYMLIAAKQGERLESPELKDFDMAVLTARAAEHIQKAEKIFARSFSAMEPHKWETMVAPDGAPMIEYKIDVDPLEVGLPGKFKDCGGTVDWVARERETGAVWKWDFKTGRAVKKEDYFELQLQAGFYLRLLKHVLGKDIVGTINYQIRSDVPERPKLTKKGSMSRGKVKSDWATYKQALLDAGLSPDLYQDMRDKLSASPWQRVDRYYRTPAEVEAVWETVFETARSMLINSRNGLYPRLLKPFVCSWCDLRELCAADIRGHDTEFMLRTTFARGAEPADWQGGVEAVE